MTDENDLIKVKDVVEIINKVKSDSKNSLVVYSERILKYVEAHPASTRNQIRRAFHRCALDDFQIIMITLLQAGLIEETTLSNKIVYRSL